MSDKLPPLASAFAFVAFVATAGLGADWLRDVAIGNGAQAAERSEAEPVAEGELGCL